MEAFGQWIAESSRLIRLGSRLNRREIACALANQQLVRVYRNAYIPSRALWGLEGWELADAVLAVRITALCLVRGSSSPLSHSTALVAHGAPPLREDHREIHVLKTRGGARPDFLPQLAIGSRLISPKIPIIAHQCDALPRTLSYPQPGIACVEPHTAAAQCALSLPPDRAVCSVSAALRLLSHFDRFDLEASRRREECERQRIAEAIGISPSTRGRARAREVLSVADGACESVQERRLLWILTSMGFRNVRTQVEYSIEGRRLYVDFEIDRGGVRLVIEFDGKTKYGNTPGAVLASLTERDQREKLLVAEGLRVVRFESFELDDPQRVAEEIASALGMRALPRPRRDLLLD